MIVTVTANPSLDRTAPLSGPLRRGEVLRVGRASVVAAGKGVNISRALCHAGVETLAVVPAGAADPMLVGLEHDAIPHRAVAVAEPVRTNLTLTEPDGTTTKINAPGADLSATEADALEAAVVEAATGARWVVLSGSLPPGLPTDWYARMVPRLHDLGVRVAVDTSDAPLAALVEALPGAAPDLLKPNAAELAQVGGGKAEDLEAAAARGDFAPVVAAARRLAGIGEVLVTLGGAGALLVTADRAWFASVEPVAVRSTVGAGDSSLAGHLIARCAGAGPADCLASAVAWGTAAACLPGSTLPTPTQAAAVHPTVRSL